MKKRFYILDCLFAILLIASLFSSCSNIKKNIKKSDLESTLVNGYWEAKEENNDSDLDIEFGNKFGFDFKKKRDYSNYNGIALTETHLCWRYKITDEETIKIYSLDSTNADVKLMFEGYYDENIDMLVLMFTEASSEYYDVSIDKVLFLSHNIKSKITDINEKLIFEIWATVNDSSIYCYNGFDNMNAYKQFRESLYQVDNNVEIYEFYCNYDEMIEGNMRRVRYVDGAWKYKPFLYKPVGVGGITEENYMLEILKDFSDESNPIEFNEDYTKLTFIMKNEELYRVTRFTD